MKDKRKRPRLIKSRNRSKEMIKTVRFNKSFEETKELVKKFVADVGDRFSSITQWTSDDTILVQRKCGTGTIKISGGTVSIKVTLTNIGVLLEQDMVNGIDRWIIDNNLQDSLLTDKE